MLPIAPWATGAPSRYPPASSVPGAGAFTRRRYRSGRLSTSWRKLGGGVASPASGSGSPLGDPTLRPRRGQQQRRSGPPLVARAPGAAAARLPRLPPDARLPALRARGRPVADGRARLLRLRALRAALQAAARA